MDNLKTTSLPSLWGKPNAGNKCGECGRSADRHFRVGHNWVKTECERDAQGYHIWSQSGDSGHEPCSHCRRRNINLHPEDWPEVSDVDHHLRTR